MPVTEFAGDATVRIGGQGGATFALPFSSGRVIAKPKRPDGPAFRELVDGRRKERRADGFYLDVALSWEELSVPAYATLLDLIDALHVRADSTKVYFKPVAAGDATIDYWKVVPALDQESVNLIYENRVRAREASLTLKARDATPSLPGWLR